MELFLELNRGGQTIVMVTHNRELAASAHRVVSMRDGLIEGGAAMGDTASLAGDLHDSAVRTT